MLLKVHVVTLKICPGLKTFLRFWSFTRPHLFLGLVAADVWLNKDSTSRCFLMSQQYCVTGGGETWREASVESFHLLENKVRVTSTKIIYYFIKTHTYIYTYIHIYGNIYINIYLLFWHGSSDRFQERLWFAGSTFDHAEFDCSWLGLSCWVLVLCRSWYILVSVLTWSDWWSCSRLHELFSSSTLSCWMLYIWLSNSQGCRIIHPPAGFL